MLGLLGTAPVVGSAGCAQLGRKEFRLHFVRVHNTSVSEVAVGVRVRRDGEAVFETWFEGIPSFRVREYDEEDPETHFVDIPNVRLVESGWSSDPAVYDLEYKLSREDSWAEADFDDLEAEHVGFNVAPRSTSSGKIVITKTFEFEDEGEVAYLLGRDESTRSDGNRFESISRPHQYR